MVVEIDVCGGRLAKLAVLIKMMQIVHFGFQSTPQSFHVGIVVDPPSAAGAELLDTPETMLDLLFNDIINDVIAPRESTCLNDAHTLTESEESKCRRRITAILETIEGGGAECLEYLDDYIQDYQERYAGGGELCWGPAARSPDTGP